MTGKGIAVVTGASSGLGWEFAREISRRREADEIWVVGRRKKKLEELSALLPVRTRILSLDLVEETSFTYLAHLLEEEKPDISLLINNAGRGSAVSFADEDLKDITGMMKLNMEAPVKLTRISLPYMRNGAGIINVCSAASFLPLPGFSIYSASKSFLLSFSRSLAEEVKNRGIRVTALCPYWIRDTELMDKAGLHIDPTGALTARMVAEQGLRDNRKGKKISIPGLMGKLTRLGAACFPLSFLLFFKKLFHA